MDISYCLDVPSSSQYSSSNKCGSSSKENIASNCSGLNSLTDLKEAVLIAIRTPPPPRSPKYCKARM